MVAADMGIPVDGIRVTVEGDLDLQGALGMSKTVSIGFEDIRVNFLVRSAAGAADGSSTKNRAVLRCNANIAAPSSNQEPVVRCARYECLM
jgi:hypothetical protein